MKHTQPATEAPIIHPQAVYSLAHLRSLLGLAASTIKAERRAGRLRVGRRGNKYYVIGRWVIEWLEAGELPSRRPRQRVSSGAVENGANYSKSATEGKDNG